MDVIKQLVEEPDYFAKRNGLYAAGKYVAVHGIAEPIGKSLQGMMTPIVAAQEASGLATGIGGVAGLVGVGLASAVSAGLVQMDYHHVRNNLKALYKEELTAKLKKPFKKITAGDLDTMAEGNPALGIAPNRVISEELGKLRKGRNFGIAFSFLATMAALAVVTFAMPAHSPGLMELFHATAEQWGTLALNTAVGLATYNAVKIPLQWMGNKLFGLDKETTHERIMGLKREHEMGKSISREQVLSVFVKAHPELDRAIEQRFGLKFDELAEVDKQHAADQIGRLAPLDELAARINSGETNATELAFAVEGQISGVHHGRMDNLKKHGRLHGMWSKMRNALRSAPQPKAEYLGMASLKPVEEITATAYAEAKVGASFVERLGRPKFDSSMGYAKQIEQQANTPLSQTIH